MPAWWHEEAKNGWRMSYSGDDPRRAEETADKMRRQGYETKTMRKMVQGLDRKSYMEYVTLVRKES